MRKSSKKNFIRILLFIGLLGCIFIFFNLKVVALPFIGGAILAYLLLPLVKWFEKRKISLPAAMVIIYGGILLLGFIIVFWAWPQMAKEVEILIADLPVYWQKFTFWWQSFMDNFQKLSLPESLKQGLEESVSHLEDTLAAWGKNSTNTVIGMIGDFFSLLLAPVLAYYILRDREAIGKMIASWLPPKIRENCLYLASEIDHLLKQFIQGYVLVSCIVGVLVTIALWLFGMKYALAIGIFAGIMDLIPYFGPVLGAIPAVWLALAQSQKMAIIVIIVFIFIQQLENLLTPKIVGEKIGLHPLLIIFAVLLGGYWFGIAGMVFGVPVVAMLKIVIGFTYSKYVAWQEE